MTIGDVDGRDIGSGGGGFIYSITAPSDQATIGFERKISLVTSANSEHIALGFWGSSNGNGALQAYVRIVATSSDY